jgi:hypothetical protein
MRAHLGCTHVPSMDTVHIHLGSAILHNHPQLIHFFVESTNAIEQRHRTSMLQFEQRFLLVEHSVLCFLTAVAFMMSWLGGSSHVNILRDYRYDFLKPWISQCRLTAEGIVASST